MVMAKKWMLLGVGPIVFGITFALSWLSERDIRRATVTSTAALAATYAGTLAAIQDPGHAGLSDTSSARSSTLPSSGLHSGSSSGEIAVFWDYENVKVAAQGAKAPLAESLVNYAQTQGHPRIKMVYSNWRRERDILVQVLYSLGFETIHVSTGKENSVDIKLTVDCLNAAYQYPDIHQFILVTADRDFVPLVNALKTLRKKVTLIGRAATASEQLLLSADEFIDIEKLSVEIDYANIKETQPEMPQSISYQEALICLTESITQARNQGKSTRFASIDLLMRSDPQFSYEGVLSIRKDNDETFSNFSAFILEAEADGVVKVQTLEGFKELFLPDEDPEAESEFGTPIYEELEREQWQLILNQVRQGFQDGQPGPLYGRFLVLFAYVRQAKKDGRLQLTNTQLQQSLSRLVDFGILVKQPDTTYRLVKDLDTREEEYISELMQNESREG